MNDFDTNSLLNSAFAYTDKFGDWVFNPHDPLALALTKVCGLSAVIFGAVAAPFLLKSVFNQRAMKRTLAKLDSGLSVIFNSVEDGVRQGFEAEACKRSQKMAFKLSGKVGNGMSYTTSQDCAAHHRSYTVHVSNVPIVTTVGEIPITNYVRTVSYVPDIVAWQALRDDLTVAVPLYSGRDFHTAVREDGKVFELHI